MGKVICFYSGKEITELPVSKIEGEMLLENLLRFEILHNPTMEWNSMSQLIRHMVLMIENNSGASRFDVMNRIYKRKV
jgi:hypothetical protein